MGYGWSESCAHVRFGQILGMSTRRGNAVLLAHLLDEARSVMQENQRRAQTTRIGGAAAEQAAERLGISALVVNDLRHRRVQDYKFSWSKALNPRYFSGFSHLFFT
jgi:arginyl-tRNA synthetase